MGEFPGPAAGVHVGDLEVAAVDTPLGEAADALVRLLRVVAPAAAVAGFQGGGRGRRRREGGEERERADGNSRPGKGSSTQGTHSCARTGNGLPERSRVRRKHIGMDHWVKGGWPGCPYPR
ncbi:hypothetical protein GCM10010381_36860 [Streptomyces xantholiticus]|nr:hypothetical protein GCM10010381_36860 [Streptomyces xantholiticus]